MEAWYLPFHTNTFDFLMQEWSSSHVEGFPHMGEIFGGYSINWARLQSEYPVEVRSGEMFPITLRQMFLGNLLEGMEGVILIPPENFKKLDGYLLRERIFKNHIHDGVGRGFPWLNEGGLYLLISSLPNQNQEKMGKPLNDRHLPIMFCPGGLYDLDILTLCGVQDFPNERSMISCHSHLQIVFCPGTEQEVQVGCGIGRSGHHPGEVYDLRECHSLVIQQVSDQLLGCRDRYDHEMFPRRFRGQYSSSDEILGMLPKYAMYSSHKKKERK